MPAKVVKCGWAAAIGLALVGPVGARSEATAAPRRVLVVSLDGAGADELAARFARGELGAGGFRPFFDRGEVAEGLVPVDPTMTAPNHATLATGFPPAATGVLGNEFRAPGASLEARVDGFATPIATETIWEAAMRQGKRVGILGWPNADQQSARRAGDWGYVWVQFPPDFGARSFVFTPDSFRTDTYGHGSDPKRRLALPKGIVSYSPPRTTSIPFVRPQERPDEAPEFDFVAIDRSDDGIANYDGLVVSASHNPLLGFAGVLEPGGWILLRLGAGSTAGARQTPPAIWVKLQSMAPDLSTVALYQGGTFPTKAYPASYTRALSVAKQPFPGPADAASFRAARYGDRGLDGEGFAEQCRRVAAFTVDAALTGLATEPWDLALVYLPSIDEAEHQLLLAEPAQRGYSATSAAAAERLRLSVWQEVDRQLARLLAGVDPATTDVVLVSDHGIAPVHHRVDVSELLRQSAELPSAAKLRGPRGRLPWTVTDNDGMAFVYLSIAGRDPDGPVPAKEAGALLAAMRKVLAQATVDGERVFAEIRTRKEAGRLGLDHPSVGDLLLFARPGFELGPDAQFHQAVTDRTEDLGGHGYRASERAMRGVFLALGPDFKPRETGTVDAAEVAPRIAKLLGIERPRRRP
ncbi:MAG: alkaline phosphatase family protein [Thermoanaerobaculia bacterium]